MATEPATKHAAILSPPATPLPDAAWAGAARPNAAPRPLPPALLAAGVALLDAAIIFGSGLLLQDLPMPAGGPTTQVVAFFTLLALSLTAATGGHTPAALFGRRRAILAALLGIGCAAGGLAAAALALGAPFTFRPSVAFVWLGVAAPLLVLSRLGVGALLRAAPAQTRQRAVLVGDQPQALRFAAATTGAHDLGLRLLGLLPDAPSEAPDAALPQLGSRAALGAMIRRGEVDQVILCMPWAEERRIRALQAWLQDFPIDVLLAPDLIAYRGGSDGPRLLRLADRPLRGWAALVKGAEDYTLALLALALTAVPMTLIALAVRLDSPGPALFRKRRTGFNNRDFFVLKFRTMYADGHDPGLVEQVVDRDPRITPVGAILRRTSLDELPQIFNVLLGEMSFFGPRPHAPGTRAGGRPFEEVMARYAARHRVKPGLTGLAQVRGWRGPTETEEKLIRRVESDLEYIETWSPWLDAVILVRTLLAVAMMRNAK